MSANGKLCGACAEIVNNAINIYDSDYDNIQYMNKFKVLLSDIVFDEDDYNLPEYICSNCCTKLKDAYSFKKQCISSMEYLKKYERNFQDHKPQVSNLKNVDIKLEKDLNEKLTENTSKNIDTFDTSTNIAILRNCIKTEEVEKELQNEFGEIQNDDAEVQINESEEEVQEQTDFVSLSDPFKDSHYDLTGGYQNERESDENENKSVVVDYLTLTNVKTEGEGNAKVQLDEGDVEEQEQEQNDFFCFMCGNNFRFQSEFQTHLTVVHLKGANEEENEEGTNRFVAGNLVIKTEEIEIKEECDAEDETHMIQREKIYSCKKCNQQFDKKKYIELHLAVVHNNKQQGKSYSCKGCQKQFSRKHNLTSHVNTVHRSLKPYSCEECPKQFSYKSNFNKHVILAHTVEKLARSAKDNLAKEMP